MAGYDAKSCNALQKPYYRPIEVAIRWCGLVEYEAAILTQLERAGVDIPVAGQFPKWPCLRVNTEKIYDAIAHGEIPCGRDGRTVRPDEQVAQHRRTVRHTDLRVWMAKHYPDQKPEFLFDETERSAHAAINADSFRALQADLLAARANFTREEQRREKIAKERDALLGERDSLRSMVEKMTANALNPSERKSLLKMIFVMAVDCYGYDPNEKKSPVTNDIFEAAAKADTSISPDTIRKWLKEGAALRKDDF